MIDTSRSPIQHGELILRPIVNIPVGKSTRVSRQVVAHSESGAHHILIAPDFEVINVRNEDGTETMYLSLPNDGSLQHEKTGPDQHKTLPVAPGNYMVSRKTEYSPFDELVRNVAD